MTLEQDIAQWASTRPPWQQTMLSRLASGQALEQSDLAEIAQKLVESRGISAVPLRAEDVPGRQAGGDPVCLEAVDELQNINALSDEAKITVATEGLTVIYGDNATGKSGYARVVKAVTGARHREDILGDVFSKAGGNPQSARVTYRVGGDTGTAAWPAASTPELRRIHFYDSACGDTYLSTETELTYRPSALGLLDQLVRACDAVRHELDAMLVANDQSRRTMPEAPEGTKAATLLAALSASTSTEDVDAAGKLPSDAAEKLAGLIQEEARLRASDPAKERQRLEALAAKLEAVAGHIQRIAEVLGKARVAELLEAKKNAGELRTAAALASSDSFKTEPLPGVGSTTWRTLWEAARAFSVAEAYCDHEFPFIGDDARCVLCHQELSDDAGERLGRFEAFMRDTTAQKADTAERNLAADLAVVEGTSITPPEVVRALTELEPSRSDLASQAGTWLEAASKIKAGLVARLEEGSADEVPDLPSSPETDLRDASSALRAESSSIDATKFGARLGEIVTAKNDLEAGSLVVRHRGAIDEEIRRLQERAKIESAKQATDTSGITRKVSELTRKYVTETVKDRFTRESERLHLERITLADVGGQKGQLRHKPQLLGAEQAAAVANVLSEGEQTALGVAGFFTETHFDESKSAMVLDDPVTSLDHVRRPRVAKRLVEYAKDRQVVVFTHDVSFVGELSKAAEEAAVPFTERSVERRGNSLGISVDQHPWKVKDVRKRLGALEDSLAGIKRDKDSWDQETYGKECADWGGSLRETWERIINLEIVNQVVDRATLEVRPTKFRLLACITETDDREFQASYKRCSTWARGHDKSPEVNYVPPQVDELEEELKLVRTWFDRVRRYLS